MVVNGSLRGAGDTMPGLYGTIAGRIIVAVSLAYLFGIVLDFGVVGVWWASVIGTVVQTLIVGVRWLRRQWLDVALHKSDVYRQHLQYLPKVEQERYLSEVRTPLMKEEGTTEEVNDISVIYNNPRHVVQVMFSDKQFSLDYL